MNRVKNRGVKLFSLITAMLLSMAMIVTNTCMVFAAENSEPCGFSGDSESPSVLQGDDEDSSHYKQIRTIADLYGINNDLKGKYILMNDIDMSSTDGGDYDLDGSGWKPIGLGVDSFRGVLDGNGHKLKNLTIKPGRDYAGLFYYIGWSGHIKNLAIENIKITSDAIRIGTIASYSDGTIERCYVTGTIESTNGNSYANVGGITNVHSDDCKIYDCYTDVAITTVNGDSCGMCAENGFIWFYEVSHCYSIKPVKSNSIDYMISPRNSECYYLTVPGETRSDPDAQGLSNGMMRTASSFTGFNFRFTWYIDPHAPNNNYPQLVSCPQDRITSIEIEKLPDRLEYTTSENSIDLTGGTIKIKYEDGTVVKGVEMDEAVAFYDLLPAGKQTVHLYYGGLFVAFDITVKKTTPRIAGKMEYIKNIGDYFKIELATDSDGDIKLSYDPEDGDKVIRLSPGGYVECLKEGEAVIEAAIAETDKYESVSEEIQVTVKGDGSAPADDDDDDDDDDENEGPDGTKYYKVIFDSNGGSAISKQKVEEGEYVHEPGDPIKQGFVFGGWYSDKEFYHLWDFDSNKVYSNITLYAKWVTEVEKAKEESVLVNGDIVLRNGTMYFLSGTKIRGADLFTNAGNVYSSNNSVAKVNKKGFVTFKKDGEATLTADTGESINIVVFGKKPVTASVRVGDIYSIPDEILVETHGDLRYTNASKVVVSDDGKLTALAKGTVKVKYTQSGKTRVVLKLKISS